MIEFLSVFIVKCLIQCFESKIKVDTCIEDDIDKIMNGLYEVGDEFKI